MLRIKGFLKSIVVYLKDYGPYLDSFLFVVILELIRTNLLGTYSTRWLINFYWSTYLAH